jgi:hypothetical protein
LDQEVAVSWSLKESIQWRCLAGKSQIEMPTERKCRRVWM